MLNAVKHLGCAHVDVHEILRSAQDDIAYIFFYKIRGLHLECVLPRRGR